MTTTTIVLPDGWDTARQWQAYAQRVKEERDALRETVKWLQNVTHEVYHQTNSYDAQVNPDAPPRRQPNECPEAACKHTTMILRSITP